MSQPPPLPLPAPLPVELLPTAPEGYTEEPGGREHRRPGIISAIAIISIIVGSLGIIGGGLSSLYAAVFYLIGQTTTAVSKAQATIAQLSADAPTASADDGPIITEPSGVEADQRKKLIDGLSAVRGLNDARRTQLDALFAKIGQDAFPGSDAGLTAVAIKQSVGSYGELQPADDAAPGARGADYFELTAGRIEVSDDRALFAPSDHSISTTRVARKIDGQTPAAKAVTAPPPPVRVAMATLPTRGPVNGTTTSLVVCEGAISLLLSVYLLVIGIMLLRQNRFGWRLHLIYLLLKIPLAIACGVCWWYLLGEFFNAVRTPTGAPGPVVGARVGAIFLTLVFPLVYPISLMFVLLTPSVKRYFDDGLTRS